MCLLGVALCSASARQAGATAILKIDMTPIVILLLLAATPTRSTQQG
jgi:hypothetical protein